MINRIKNQLDLSQTGKFVLVYGNVDDRFILNDLTQHSIGRLLWLYLKQQQFKRIVFFDSSNRLRCFDEESYKSTQVSITNEESTTSDFDEDDFGFGDDGPLGGANKEYLSTKKVSQNNTNIGDDFLSTKPIEGKQKKSVWVLPYTDINVVSTIETFLADDAVKTAVIFSQFNENYYRDDIAYNELKQRFQKWGSYDNENKCFIIFKAKELFTNRNGEAQPIPFLEDFPTLQGYARSKTPNTLEIRYPQRDEITSLLQYYRLFKKTELDWLNIDRIVKGLHRKRDELTNWRKKLVRHAQKHKNTIFYQDLLDAAIISKTASDEEEKYLNKEKLNKKLSLVKCQEDNTLTIADDLTTFYVKPNKGKPFSFFLVGTSGVGKTFTTELVAEALEYNGYEYVYFAMSEYQDEHSRSKIIGSPPGFVGSTAKPKLLEHIQDNEKLIICFDEIEKAHPDILKTLMQLLDKGSIDFNVNGKSIEGNFRECIIFFTSNAQMEKLVKTKKNFQKKGISVNHTSFQNRIKKILQDAKIAPELTGRINKYLVYNSLDPKSVIEIAHQEINRLNENIEVIYTDPEYLAQTAFEAAGSITGARDIKNKIASTLEGQINVLTKKGKYIVQQIEGSYQLIEHEKSNIHFSYEEMVNLALERYERIEFESFQLDIVPIQTELSQVYGQQDNVEQIIERLEFWYPKRKKKRPLSFFLVGTSGVGKTFTAKQLTKALKQANYEEDLIYFDMNDFKSSTDISKLKGSARGFAGSNEQPRIFEALENSKNGKLVICFDEIEKAHPTILTSLMQLLDEGFMEWNKGKGDFRNCVIFFTSNAQMQQLISFKQQFKAAQKDIKDLEFQNQVADLLVKAEVIKTEVSGRISKFLVYNPLEEKDILKIAFQEIEKLAQSYSIQKVVWVAPILLAQIAIETAGNPLGVRPITKLIEDKLGKILSKFSTEHFKAKEVAIIGTDTDEYKAIPATELSLEK